MAAFSRMEWLGSELCPPTSCGKALAEPTFAEMPMAKQVLRRISHPERGSSGLLMAQKYDSNERSCGMDFGLT